jgi:exoribonuclease-2
MGSLNFQTIELIPLVDAGEPVGLEQTIHNRAHELIENFMIAANVAMTRFLLDKKLPVIKRIVRAPERWDRIVEIAKNLGEHLPAEIDVVALNQFLIKQHQTAPEKFADLSLAIIKLIGRGEYAVGRQEMSELIHFDLALIDYSHTTAPNRRYPDLIMQRLLKSNLNQQKIPYTDLELNAIAIRCTLKEDDATKVERRLRKSASAMVMQKQIGKVFPAIVTGANEKGTWVRLKAPPVEGKVIGGAKGLDVGDLVNMKLVQVDIENGFIDFVRVQ